MATGKYKVYSDRFEAGKELAKKLLGYKKFGAIILALPRGGVEVAAAVAKNFKIPLEVIVARKLSAPQYPEYGIGAISEQGALVLRESDIRQLNLSREELKEIIRKEKAEMRRRISLYRQGRDLPNLEDKTVILVDDGLATGVTAKAALKFIKTKRPKQVVLAVPISASGMRELFKDLADEIVILQEPETFFAVGQWYREFPQLSDKQVVRLLRSVEQGRIKSFQSRRSAEPV